MDTALHAVISRRTDAALHMVTPSSTATTAPTVPVIAAFRLSQAGRKASLMAGGDGKSRQRVVLQVPATRMHLVHVDRNGTARLKLKPRFEVRASHRVVRLYEPPTYDAPPSLETLLQDAARNHELEAAYHAQGVDYRTRRVEASQDWRNQLAESFLADVSQRAVMHPSPTKRRCVIATERGRLDFDAKRDRGIARTVPREAYRRFCADLLARRQRGHDEQAEFHAAHTEKLRLTREWITEHGSDDQRARLAAGVLPLDEAVESMTAVTFQAVAHIPEYSSDGAARLQAHLRTFAPYADAVISGLTLSVVTRYLTEATSAQWAVMQAVQAAVPDVRVFVRERILSWTTQPKAPRLRIVTVLGYKKVGPLTLRREFCVPDMCAPMPESNAGAA